MTASKPEFTPQYGVLNELARLRTSSLTPCAKGSPANGAATSHTFIATCAKAGFTPDITMEASEPLAALGLVAAGLGMTMIQQSLRHQAPPGVVLHELPWFQYRTSLWVAWHRVNLRPLVETFRKTLEEGRVRDVEA